MPGGRRPVAGHAADYESVDQSLDAQWGAVYAASINHYLREDAQRERFPVNQSTNP